MSRETCQSTIQVDTSASHRTIQKTYQHLNTFVLLFAIFSALLLVAGCSHSDGGGGGVTDADPTGYYDAAGGSASVKQDNDMDDLLITDLQALVQGNQIKMMSAIEGLLYDVNITSIEGDNYSGDVTIFKDGAKLSTATVSGMITKGSSITGTLSGIGAGNGTFELVFATSNSQASDLARIKEDAPNTNPTSWYGATPGIVPELVYHLDSAGTIFTEQPTISIDIFAQCEISGIFSIVPNTSLYSVNVTLDQCATSEVNGNYTGLAASRSIDLASELVLAVSNSTHALYSNFYNTYF
jgi:hypothetical protein